MRASFVRAAMVCAIVLIATGSARAAPSVGAPVPALTGLELDGHAFDLSAWRGKTVIVNFWASWCAPCRREMPVLNAFYQRYHGRGLEVIGISTDRPHDRDDAVRIMQAFSYPAAMMRDLTANGFGAPGAIPVTYVIDSSGVVRASFSPTENGVTEDQLDQAVLPLLGATPLK